MGLYRLNVIAAKDIEWISQHRCKYVVMLFYFSNYKKKNMDQANRTTYKA